MWRRTDISKSEELYRFTMTVSARYRRSNGDFDPRPSTELRAWKLMSVDCMQGMDVDLVCAWNPILLTAISAGRVRYTSPRAAAVNWWDGNWKLHNRSNESTSFPVLSTDHLLPTLHCASFESLLIIVRNFHASCEPLQVDCVNIDYSVDHNGDLWNGRNGCEGPIRGIRVL